MSTPMLKMLKSTIIYGGGIIGLGVVLFKYTVPTEEELLARMSPEVRAKVERERALRQLEQQRLMEIVQITSKSNEPIWKTGELYNPWEKTGQHLLIDKVEAERHLAEEKVKSELEAIKQQEKELK
ncbi:Cbp4 protein [Martiniozyma asiatica (nom. inval.)]|nr:Cbp4 protein [Martiniozyma asiatica]